ncbi:MAG: serine protease [Candidatus Omnitrophica bacterium]|nr:serine protease [Candidatus Omnitrophota bacterium]
MNKRLRYLLQFFLIVALLAPSSLYAQESLINNILNVEDSIVHVIALQTNAYAAPTASAGINPKTGQIFVGRRILKADYTQQGAGVIISADGLVVTNFHTIRGADNIAVRLHTQETFGAKIVYLSPGHDLALLKIMSPHPLKPVDFADSNTVKLGDDVINIGSSDILNGTISGGVVNGLGTSRTSQNTDNVEVIKVYMNIYKGDSGGPLLNRQGQLIGMMAAKLEHHDRASLAIPSNKIKKLYLEFINKSYNGI